MAIQLGLCRTWLETKKAGFLDGVYFLLQYFVDLAGSEKAGENSGDRFKEGCAINKSLFALGNVIRKLSGDEKYENLFGPVLKIRNFSLSLSIIKI